uniref:Methyltransferase FkbM domain-containing protein n=1 Tax=Biomphalaria glabrata TaxID=6526 RepID=A0A2C9LMC6_BIOGL
MRLYFNFRNNFIKFVPFIFIIFLVQLLPKPDWLCGGKHWNARPAQNMTWLLLSLKTNVLDPHNDASARMFPIYNRIQANDKRESFAAPTPFKVNVFHLQNTNFHNFSRNWVNKALTLSSSISLESLRKSQNLPDCVQMKVPPEATPTRICVHFPKDDNFISNRLRDSGEWEMDLVYQMDTYFTINPNSQLVDLGCNIGVFTLFAASLGKHALALDILPSNLALLQLSILTNDEHISQTKLTESDLVDEDIGEVLQHVLGARKLKSRSQFSHLITTVHNAIHSRRQKMQIYLKPWDSNLGGTEVKDVTSAELNTADPHILVDAICLDDLLPFVKPNLSIFLKIDIEGSEPEVFQCASNFFMYADVRVILMEILFHRHSKQGKTMAQFLLSRNMLPSEDVNGAKLLNPDLYKMYEWPENIFWVKVR